MSRGGKGGENWGYGEGRKGERGEDSKGRGVTGLSVTAVGYMEAQVQFDL